MTESKQPKVFISYAWEEDTKNWVREFAARLRSDGVDTILDQWHVIPGDSLPEFMEKSVGESDFVLVICTPAYKRKSESEHPSGVVYEKGVITGELFVKRNQRKFIPILQKGEWRNSAPSWVLAKTYIDLSDNPYSENSYTDLLRTLYSEREFAPPLGSKPDFSKPVIKQKKRNKPVSVKKNSPSSKKTNIQKTVFGVALVGFVSLVAFSLPSLSSQTKPTLEPTKTREIIPSKTTLPKPSPTHTIPAPSETAPPTLTLTITLTPSPIVQPATMTNTVSPTPVKWIAFHSEISGNSDIYIVDANGRNSQKIIDGSAHEGYPSWSPDGRRIVYQTNEGGDFELAIFSFDTKKTYKITQNECGDWDPSWSPDGKWILFYSNCDTDEGKRDIYKIRIDGTERTQLTNSFAPVNWAPSWSPDGKFITFTSNYSGNYRIYVMDKDGGIPQQLEYGCGSIYSPDGTQILYSEFCLETSDFLIMNSDGSNARWYTNGLEGKNATWSPDGTKIVFQESPNKKEGPFALYIMSLPDKNLVKLVDYDMDAHSPAWQP